MSKSILDLLNDELAKARQDIQDAEKRESDILKAIEAIEESELSGQEIEAGDTVRLVSTDKTEERYSINEDMYFVGDEFVVHHVNEDVHNRKRVYDSNKFMYALVDLKLIKKKS